MPVTTSKTLKESQGQMCHDCGKRTKLARWQGGKGWVCPDCDPRENLVTLADPDAPVDRGEGAPKPEAEA